MYETVSEGTPVTPAFATREELVEYLVQHGDYWDQSRFRSGSPIAPEKLGWDPAQAESFVSRGFAMSAIIDGGGKAYAPRDQGTVLGS